MRLQGGRLGGSCGGSRALCGAYKDKAFMSSATRNFDVPEAPASGCGADAGCEKPQNVSTRRDAVRTDTRYANRSREEKIAIAEEASSVIEVPVARSV